MKYLVALSIFLFSFNLIKPNPATIIGKVVDDSTGLPIQSASVFISNTTIGDVTGINGKFVLNIPQKGAFVLVASHLSYEIYSLTVPLDKDTVDVLIKLKFRAYEIKSVKVSANDPYRSYYLYDFKFGLIGATKNAELCEIVNPSAIRFIYLSGTPRSSLGQFLAEADSVLVIENKALAYSINYNLAFFATNDDQTVFYGFPMYVDLKRNLLLKNKIDKARNLAYEGSKMHFFRSLYANCLQEEGFETYWVDETLKGENDTIDYLLMEDSVFIGKPKNRLLQTRMRFNLYDSVKTIPNSDRAILSFKEPFEIRYTKRGEELKYLYYPQYYLGLTKHKGSQTTIARIINSSIVFYPNGSYDPPYKLVTIGYWSSKKMADLLPYNYSAKED
jgi:hypothetical protein